MYGFIIVNYVYIFYIYAYIYIQPTTLTPNICTSDPTLHYIRNLVTKTCVQESVHFQSIYPLLDIPYAYWNLWCTDFCGFIAYLFPMKINPPELFLQLYRLHFVTSKAWSMPTSTTILQSSHGHFFWKIARLSMVVYCLLPVTSHCSYGLATQEDIAETFLSTWPTV